MDRYFSRAHSARHSVAPTKTPREMLLRLDIDTGSCPQVLLRILGLIAQHHVLPLSIATKRCDDGQQVCIELDPLGDSAANTLLARIEMMVMVRAARMSTPTAEH